MTLVEGATHAFLTYVMAENDPPLTLGYDCDLQDGVAVCSGVEEGTTYTATETISAFDVVIGTTAAVTGDSASSTANVSGSGKSGTATSSSSGAQNTSNGADMPITSSFFTLGFAVGLTMMLL